MWNETDDLSMETLEREEQMYMSIMLSDTNIPIPIELEKKLREISDCMGEGFEV
jgi:hypothetical protein